MLNIGKIGAGPEAGRYYERRIASGVEDYYAGKGEAPGAWLGTGARHLGLNGRVGEQEVVRLLAAQQPTTGAALRKPLGDSSVAGFDLTFKAPKSVGLLFGIAEEVISAQVRDGHEAAVREALGYLERHACIVRRGHAGAIQLAGGGFVAAAFRHRTSRAGDPLLHTHVVIANEAQGPDGRWTALDGRPIYGHSKTAGYLYQAVLRAELSERLGVRWQPVRNGYADIDGVSREAVEKFSTRRGEILQTMADRGEHSARAAQVAALDTRRGKDHDIPIATLRQEWRERALDLGIDHTELGELLHRDPTRPITPADLERHAEWLLGPEGLTRQSSSFNRPDVVRAFAQHADQGAHVAVIERRADQLLCRSPVARLDNGRFSTRELLALEARLLRDAADRSGEYATTVRGDDLKRALQSRPTLSDEQRELVERLTTGPGGVQVVRAPAGTGKTFALDAAREAWEHAGVPVLGCALSARAACELRDQAALQASTIARVRHALDRGADLQRGSVLIVDEAGMVGTRDLAALSDATDAARGRLVLVGDDRQLPEIDAGGAFRALADQQDATQLQDVRRQREDWDRAALAELRSGDIEQFARAYLEHGRIVMTPTASAAREALVADWWNATRDGADALMIATRRADVADLNARARQHMRDAGKLEEDGLTTETRGFAVGDRVIATHNDQRLGVHNGQTGTLRRISDDRVVVELEDGKRLTLPAAYAHDGHLDHGYALTAHRAQGATVDQAFVLGSDEQYREWGYTALSRHRDQARYYLSATPAFLNTPPEPLTTNGDVERAVVDALKDSRAEHLAITHVRRDVRLDNLDRTNDQITEAQARRDQLQAERDATPRYRRADRARLDQDLERAERTIGHHQDKAEGYQLDLAERTPRRPPELAPAGDPLAELEVAGEPMTRPPTPFPDRDLGLDSGPDLGM